MTVDDDLLRAIAIALGVLVATANVLWLGYAALSTFRARRIRRRNPRTLTALARALAGGDPGPAVAILRRLPRQAQTSALVEMAFTVAGAQRARLDEVANAAGILATARRLSRARRWGPRLRAARLIALFGSGDEDFGERLLRDPSADVRAQAAEWAGEHPTPARVELLAGMLMDRDPRCRFFAGEALSRVGAGARPALASLLGEAAVAERPASELEAAGVRAALEVGRSISAPDLLPPAVALTGSPDPSVRQRAAALAASIGGPQAAAALVTMLRDPHPDARAAAAQGLGHLAHWPAAASVATLLDDGSWQVRYAAARALTRMGPTGELLLRRAARRPGTPGWDVSRRALNLKPAREDATLEEAAA